MFFVGYYQLRDLSDTKIFAYDKLGKRSAIKGPQPKIGLRDYYSEFGKIAKVTHFSVKKIFSYAIISQIAFFLRDDMKIFNHYSTYKKKKKLGCKNFKSSFSVSQAQFENSLQAK